LRRLGPTYPLREKCDELWVHDGKVLDRETLIERGMRVAGARF
jgi:hypothetical protein